MKRWVKEQGRGQLNGHDLVPVLYPHLMRRRADIDAGRVDHNVRRPIKARGFRGNSIQRVALGDIADDISAAYGGRNLAQAVFAPGDAHHLRAARMQCTRQRRADARAGAVHNGNVAGQVE